MHLSNPPGHKFVIEVLLPSIDLDELDIIEDLIGDLHPLISGF